MWYSILMMAIQWAVTATLGAAAAYFGAKQRSRKREDEEAKQREAALEAGMRNLLRREIIQIHKETMELGYCPIDTKEAVEDSYIAYHALGGDGIITKLYQDVMDLPEEPPRQGK